MGICTVDDNNIAALDPLFSQDTGEDFDFIEQLGVGVFLGCVGDGGLPDDGDILAMA